MSRWDVVLSNVHIELICRVVGVNEEDIYNVYVNPGRSANNENYVFDTRKGSYLLRIPGKGSELFSDRAIEKLAYLTLAPFGITDEVIHLSATTGEKISVYYKDSHIPRSGDDQDLLASMQRLHDLHQLDVKIPQYDNLFDRIEKYKRLADQFGGTEYFLPEYYTMLDSLKKSKKIIESVDREICFTHGDASINNILITKEHSKPILIDMEFAAMGDPYSDIATFCVDADYRESDINKVFSMYLGRESTNLEKYQVLSLCVAAAMMWYGWAAYKIAIEHNKEPYFAFRNDYQAYILDVYKSAEVHQCEIFPKI